MITCMSTNITSLGTMVELFISIMICVLIMMTLVIAGCFLIMLSILLILKIAMIFWSVVDNLKGIVAKQKDEKRRTK